MKLNPYIDDWVVQESGYVPNEQLGPYWLQLAQRYDLFVQLCESVEGTYLALPGRREDMFSDEVRRRILGSKNYLEYTHDLAGVPYNFAPKFYPSEDELAKARAQRAEMNGPVIYWAINGSSPHKLYAYPQAVIAWLLEKTNAHVVLTGDGVQSKPIQDALAERLERDGFDVSRFHGWCGKQTIRESLTFAQVVDVVVGPETGVLNAVCMEDVWKVIYLSHSSHENLTKHWKNTIVLQADPERAPCYPCHRLHFDWSRCHQDEKTTAALCAAAISPKLMFDVLCKVLTKVKGTKELATEAA